MSLTAKDKPWLKSYPSRVPEFLDSPPYPHLAAFIYSLAERYGTLPAFTNFGTTHSFQDIIQKAEYFAGFLQSLGYQKGDRFAIMMPNLLQYPVVFYGCLLAGVIAVNVNPLYTARELRHQLHDAGAKGIIIAENFAHTFADVRTELPEVKDVVITAFGDELGFFKGMALNIAIRHFKKLVPNYRIDGAIDYKNALKQGRSHELQTPELSLDDTALLQYTGGTTGLAKGAKLSHRNLLANIQQVDCWIGNEVNESGLVLITALPLYHVFCCTVNALYFPSRGMHNILVTNPRDMKSFIRLLKKRPFHVMTGVNTLFKGLLHQPEFKHCGFSKLRFVIAGGMPLEKVVADEWQKVTGNVIIEGYGLTETSPIVFVNLLYNDAYTGGCGYPMPSTEISLHNDNGEEVPVGEPGVLWVKGPQVMQGYWQNDEATASTIVDGWLDTGDIATMNENGLFKIVDRKKDMVLVSGFNVYPTEVEAVLSEHPDVAEVCVIGVPSQATGEKVKAFIVRKAGSSLTADQLIGFANENLTGYKRPKEYEFIDELPKSNIGKVLRRELAEREKQKAAECHAD